MIVGTLTVELAILDAQSLKDKRRVIQSVKQRLSNRFNVSVAEVGHVDSPKRCRLGVAIVSTDARLVHSRLDKMIDLVRASGGLTLLEYDRRLL